MNKGISTNSDTTIYNMFYYHLQINILKQSRRLMVIHFWLFNAWKLPRRIWSKDEDGNDILVLNKHWVAYYKRLDNYRNNILHYENHWTYQYWIERP